MRRPTSASSAASISPAPPFSPAPWLSLAWALSQIGPQRPGSGKLCPGCGVAGGAQALAMLAGYAVWERFSSHPMTPPWLLGQPALCRAQRRNPAGLHRPGGHVLPAVLRSHRPPPPDAHRRRPGFSAIHARCRTVVAAAWSMLADRISAPRHAESSGPLGAALAFMLLALGKDASLTARRALFR